MNQDSELWAFDEPYSEAGGNSHVTMTRRQAINWMRKMYPFRYCGPVPDNTIFFDWMTTHWAYPEPTASPSTEIEAND